MKKLLYAAITKAQMTNLKQDQIQRLGYKNIYNIYYGKSAGKEATSASAVVAPGPSGNLYV